MSILEKEKKAMFGMKKSQETQVDKAAQTEIRELERMAAIPFPQGKVPARLVEPSKQRSYEEVAQLLGFMPAELVRAQLLEFFEEEGIKLYDYAQVGAWLTKKKVEAGVQHWCWRPLREKDVITDYMWGYDAERATWSDGFYSSSSQSKSWECRPYARLVPRHALENVAKIEAKFGDRVKFFVSDYAHPDVDPFIMVRPAMCNDGGENYRLIFDVWDEPGFGI